MRLKDLLGAGGLNLKFVFVSACYSKEIGEAFVKAGVKHVVCVKVDSKIQDVAAIAFTRAFYVAFLSSRTVEDSFQIAKEALKASPYVPDSLLEGEKFILLPDKATFEITGKDGTSAPLNELHNKVIFQNRTVKNWPGAGQCTIGPNYTDVDAFLTRSRIPSPPTDFVGREVFLHSLIRSILDRRLVSLVGEDGLGKTAVACAACHYLAEREAFSDSIVFLRAKGLKDYRSFLSGLQSAILSSGSNAVSKRLQILLSKEKSSSSVNLIYPEEEQIFACLEPAKLLLAIDKLDDLLSDYGDSTTDFRLFLGRLFETCPNVKILIISTDTLSMHNITIGSGVVEYSVALGPLTLHSSVRMFARLTPSLSTLRDKSKFISSMQPPGKHSNVTVDSRDVSPTALQLLNLFGDGNPSKIIHMACESTPESVAALVNRGQRIIKDSIPNFMPDSDDGSLTSSGTAGAYYF